MIVCSDHSQSQVEDEIDLFRAFDGFAVLPPSGARETKGVTAEIALCPSSRAAQVYILDRDDRALLIRRVVRRMLGLEGVDLVMHLTDHPDGEAAVHSSRGEVRFAPRGDLTDLRGETWSVEGDTEVLALDIRDGRVTSDRYPDALGRVWSSLRCRTSGEVRRLGEARDGSSSTGAGRTTSAADRMGRSTRTTRSARCSGAGRGRTTPPSATNGRCATSSRWSWTTSASRADLLRALVRLGGPFHVKRGRPAAGRAAMRTVPRTRRVTRAQAPSRPWAVSRETIAARAHAGVA